MSNKIHILSTMPLAQELTVRAREQGIAVDAMPFIQVSFADDKETAQEVNKWCLLPATVVFTSANAVKAVAALAGAVNTKWHIYCIGNATKEAVSAKFASAVVSGTANDAAALAAVIINDGVQEAVLFCGDKRMDTLPAKLRERQIIVQEVIVYDTVETPHVAARYYDGVLFFSPSAAESFFSVNSVGPDVVLFAIGNTTAAAIKRYSSNKIVIGETPGREELLNDAVQYFISKTAG